MAEKRSRRVRLSDESLNDHGFYVPNGTIDWKRFQTNPVLLRFHNRELDPVGKVVNISQDDRGDWWGDLVFGRTTAARDAEMNWDDGIYNAVSINGLFSIAEKNSRRVAVYVEPREVSLVPVPSNRNAIGMQSLSSVQFGVTEEIAVAEESLSSEMLETLHNFENMEEENKIETMKEVSLQTTDTVEKNTETQAETTEESLSDPGAPSPTWLSKFLTSIGFKREEKEESLAMPEVAEQTEEETTKEVSLASEEEKPEATETQTTESEESLSQPTPPLPTSHPVNPEAKVLDLSTPITIKENYMPNKPFLTALAEDGKMQHDYGVVASLATPDFGPGKSGIVSLSSIPDSSSSRDSIVSLASAMKADKSFMDLIKFIEYSVGDGPRRKVTQTIESLASGQLAANFIENADLARIAWLPLFIRQLFPPNTWAATARRASVRNSEGILWVESAMNPEVYVGGRAPLNAKDYIYDDVARGISSEVIAVQPTVWQPSNTDILGYNDRTMGMSEMQAILSDSMHSLWLQLIAEDIPASSYITMTGDPFAATGRFVINPAATGNVTGLAINDIVALKGRFMSQNLTPASGRTTLVVAEPYFTSFASSEAAQTVLTRQLSDVGDDYFDYAGVRVHGRSRLVGFDTAANNVVDLELYMDKPVDFATGYIDDTHVKPTPTATTVDIGLAFRGEDIMLALGNTHIHMVTDPNHYGWKVSMDVRTGAGVVRSDGKGVALLRPEAS